MYGALLGLAVLWGLEPNWLARLESECSIANRRHQLALETQRNRYEFSKHTPDYLSRYCNKSKLRWALIEEYRCPSCGIKWEVQRVETDSFPAAPGSYRAMPQGKDGFCPYCGTQEQDDTGWGEETITSRGDKVRVFMSCRRCRNWWYGMYVLGEPQVRIKR